MLKHIKVLIAVAVLSGTVSANVQAATVTNRDTISEKSSVQNTSVDKIEKWNHPITLWDKAVDYNVSVSQIKEWNKLITGIIHQDGNLLNLDGFNTNKTVAINKEEPTTSAAAIPAPTLAKAEAAQTASEANLAPAKAEAVIVAVAPGPAPAQVEATPTETEPSQVPVKAEVVQTVTEPSPDPATVEDTPAAEPTPAKAEATPEPAAQAPAESTPTVEAAPTEDTSSREITVKATAYTASCKGCSGITATGINIKANPNEKVIAVDPKVIPLGSKVYVEGFGKATAADTGGAIKGNRIDIFIPSEQDAVNFGVKQLKVTILN